MGRQTISRCFKAAGKYGNAVPCIEISESIRKLEKQENIKVDREKHRLIQTPQVFRGNLIKNAYMQPYRREFTDDATVVETSGSNIHLVKGNTENVKITHRQDFIIAGAIMKNDTWMKSP